MFDELSLKVVYLAGIPLVSLASHKSIKLNCVEIDGHWVGVRFRLRLRFRVLGSVCRTLFYLIFHCKCKFCGYLWLRLPLNASIEL